MESQTPHSLSELLPEKLQGTAVDEELEKLIRIAAQIGAKASDDEFCSFTSILIAFLWANDPVSSWFQDFSKEHSVEVESILRSKNISFNDREEILSLAENKEFPSGKSMWSKSAENILENAVSLATKSKENPFPLEPLDIMASYVLEFPPIHEKQLKKWKLNLVKWRSEFITFGYPQYSSEARGNNGKDVDPLDKFFKEINASPTNKTEKLLRLAITFGKERKDDNHQLTTGTLLFALVEVGSAARINRIPSDNPLGILSKIIRELAREKYDAAKKSYFKGFPLNSDLSKVRRLKFQGLSPNMHRLLRAANLMAQNSFNTTNILPEHLVAAFLKIPYSDTHSFAMDILTDMGIRIEDLRRNMIDKIIEVDSKLGSTWKGILDIPKEGLEHPPSSVSIPSIDSDVATADGIDHLDVEQEAHAFARIVASNTMTPPLSIGVFGEWGSGKTFFMEKMQAHISRLEQAAKMANEEKKPTAYHDGIVQIRFNAWHYIETNLWASLVDHIFRELDKWLRPKQEPEKIEKLFNQLATSRMLKLEALRTLIFSRQQRKKAEEKVKGLREELEFEKLRQSAISPKMFWSSVIQTFKAFIKDKPENTKNFNSATQKLGINDVENSAEELFGMLNRAQSQIGRGKIIMQSIVTKLGKGRWVFALCALIVVVPVSLIGIRDFLAWMTNEQWIKDINSAALGISSILTVVTGWIGTGISQTSKALVTLQGFQTELDKALKAEAKKHRDTKGSLAIETAERMLAEKRSAVELAETQLTESDERVSEARREFEGETARGRLNRFIRSKVANGDYAKHLGIIATIRKDFAHLAQIMGAGNEDAQNRQAEIDFQEETKDYQKQIDHLNLAELVNDGILLEEELVSIKEEARSANGELQFFNRIVLYIDDLDRCPPDKVIDVLQAIHLLLFFPLFVVVVAVDSRWVARSLIDRYKDLLSGETKFQSERKSKETAKDFDYGDRETRADEDRAATPRDYLEKIFQIPYWVRPMDDSSSIKFIQGLTTSQDKKQTESKQIESQIDTDFIEPADTLTTQDTDHAEIPPNQPPTPESTQEDTGDVNQPQAGVPKSPALLSEGEDSGSDDQGVQSVKQSSINTAESEETRELEEDSPNPNPKSMTLTDYEKTFIARLAPYVGQSPRRLKRFFNLYRLIRTTFHEGSHDMFVGSEGESWSYKVVMAQLAIVTGAPTIAHFYFRDLSEPKHSEPSTDNESTQGAGAAKSNGPMTIRELLTNLKSNTFLTTHSEWRTIDESLKLLQQTNDSHEMIEKMRYYADFVKRYSFSSSSPLSSIGKQDPK